MAFTPGRIYQGSNLRQDIIFFDDTGAQTDPSAVVFKTFSPCGGVSTYAYGTDTAVQRVAAGEYLADIVPTEAGRWHFRWEATGLGQAFAQEGSFTVQASAFYDSSSSGYST